MIDLSTKYLGIKLKNPLVVSASPLCKDLANVKRMEDAGAAAVVLHSLFEEQINLERNELDRFLSFGSDVSAEAVDMFPSMEGYNIGPEEYLKHICLAKESTRVPIIASLNGISAGGWTQYARLIEQAGADALELNIYYLPTDPELSGATIEHMHTELVSVVKQSVRIPVAVKLGPYFSAFANFAKNLDHAGADALVIFNRFYQPDFDLEQLEVTPNLVLSRSNELKLRIHWAAILFGKIAADLAITGGVHTSEDIIKSMMAGAKVAMTTSALLEQGVPYIGKLLEGVQIWMEQHGYDSIHQMQGSMSQKHVPQPAAFERGNYMKVLSSYALSSK